MSLPPFDQTRAQQGFSARNISLSGVSSITGLDRLEVRRLFIGVAPPGETADNNYRSGNEQADPVGPSSIAILKGDGELLSAGEAFSVNPVTGTLLAPRLGPHEVTGDVDLVGNTMRNAVLESPEIRCGLAERRNVFFAKVENMHISQEKTEWWCTTAAGTGSFFLRPPDLLIPEWTL